MSALYSGMFILILVLTVLLTVEASQYCSYNDGTLFGGRMYCPYSCCGSYTNRYCCGAYITGGAIAGIVIGTLCGIGILITILVVCCCYKGGRRPGRVINSQPQPRANVAIYSMNTGVVQTYSSPNRMNQLAPPSYDQVVKTTPTY